MVPVRILSSAKGGVVGLNQPNSLLQTAVLSIT